LSTNEGSWKNTGPDGPWPFRIKVIDRRRHEFLRPRRRSFSVGKFVTAIRLPSDLWATSESSRTLLASEMVQTSGVCRCRWPRFSIVRPEMVAVTPGLTIRAALRPDSLTVKIPESGP